MTKAEQITIERFAGWAREMQEKELVPMLCITTGIGDNEWKEQILMVNSQGRTAEEVYLFLKSIVLNMEKSLQ